jgi:hypothetical protein
MKLSTACGIAGLLLVALGFLFPVNLPIPLWLYWPLVLGLFCFTWRYGERLADNFQDEDL